MRSAMDEQEAVADLSLYMVRKLAARRDRGHWRRYSLRTLMEMASDEFVELADAVEALDRAESLEERVRAAEHVRLECADVANVVAFIFANAGGALLRAVRP